MTSDMNIIHGKPARPVLAALLALALACSCTVKEDRSECPCYLEVGFLGREDITDPVGIVGWEQKELFSPTFNTADYPDTYTQAVRKAVIGFGAYEGLTGGRKSGRFITTPVGRECDPLWSYNETIDCTGDRAFVNVAFHKQYATVYLNIGRTSAEMSHYSFLVEGNYNALDILSYDPVPGEYSFRPTTINTNVVQFRVPRQGDDGLTLTVIYDDQETSTFPLGAYIAALGYDWTEEDLRDIFITMDIVNGRITVGVEAWIDSPDPDIRHIVF